MERRRRRSCPQTGRVFPERSPFPQTTSRRRRLTVRSNCVTLSCDFFLRGFDEFLSFITHSAPGAGGAPTGPFAPRFSIICLTSPVGSFSTRQGVSKIITARFCEVYTGQFGSPL